METLVADSHNLSVGQLVGLFNRGGGCGGGHLLLKVEGNIAKLLFDVADNLSLGGGHHGISSLGHDLHEVVGQISSCQVETQDGMRQGKTFVNGDSVGNAISDIEDKSGGTTRGI